MGWNLHRFTLSPPALTVASDYGLSDSLPEELHSLSLSLPFFSFFGGLSRNILFWMCVDWFHNYGNKGEFQTFNCHNWFLHHAQTDRAWVHKWGWILYGPDKPAGLWDTLLWQVFCGVNRWSTIRHQTVTAASLIGVKNGWICHHVRHRWDRAGRKTTLNGKHEEKQKLSWKNNVIDPDRLVSVLK